MAHGITGFFLERARFQRRLATTLIAVALAFLAVQSAFTVRWLRRQVARALPESVLQRWGFEGPEQYVRRILLSSSGNGGTNHPQALRYVQASAQRGGRTPRRSSKSPDAVHEVRRLAVGSGNAPAELMTRARAIYGRAEVVQSEDLIIDRLVKPTYPDDAREHDIEGHVAVVARVDTLGQVVNVDMLQSSGARQLDQAAVDAVYQCRFRPYRLGGRVREVHAVFRFAFRIY